MNKFLLILGVMFSSSIICNDQISENKLIRDFGGFGITKELYNHIITILEPGSTILELGSGAGSEELSKQFKLYSIEHDPKWLNRYPTTYIYAPIVNGWYDTSILKNKLPEKYDLILVDGPTGKIGRYGFYNNIKLFNTDVPIIFDDVNRTAELKLMNETAKLLNRQPIILRASNNKKFGVIMPKTNIIQTDETTNN